MKISVDQEAQATYVKLADGIVARTQELTSAVFLDWTADGRLLGIEILDAPE